MKTRGAIIRAVPGDYEIVEMELEAPRSGEITVKMVASGLCLYFIASSLWGIAERKLLPKPQMGDAASTGFSFGSGKSSGGAKPGSNGSSGSKKSKANRKK